MFCAREQAGIHQSVTAFAYAEGAVVHAFGVGDVVGEGDGDGSLGPQDTARRSGASRRR
jgi:hypothetical protein